MEHKARHSDLRPAVDIDADGVVRSRRDLPPAHYTFQIKNFSVLFDTEVKECESGQFEAGGYHWKLVLRTNGKKNTNSHISLYLAIEDQNALSLGWEAYVNFRFFVFDQIRNNYLCIQDADGRVRRFHNLKTEWGFAQLLSHDTLNDPLEGYIVDNSCVLGTEVFVIKVIRKGVCLSMIKQPQINYFTWRINKFDTLKDTYYLSDVFLVEGHKWKLLLYPRGSVMKTVEDSVLSLFLKPDDSEIVTPSLKLYAKYKLRLRDQVNSNHCEKTCQGFVLDESFMPKDRLFLFNSLFLKLKNYDKTHDFIFLAVEHWFSPETRRGHGFSDFLSLRDLKDTSNSYLVDDTLFVECKIDVISVAKDFS